MNIIGTLSQKPWLDNSPGEIIDETFGNGLRPKQIALNFFLGAVTVMFSLFIVTFVARSQYPDFQALAGDVWQPFYDPMRLWVNTGLLFIGGIAIQASSYFAKKEKTKYAVIALAFALVFTLQFLVAQMMLWQHLHNLGYYVASNPANSYFYILTAIHGMHLVGGLLVLMNALLSFYRKNSFIQFSNSVRLCTRYWHYFFVVWLVLFALMTSSTETFETLAALCGY